MPVSTPPNKISHKFAYKILLSAFCGIHVPLIGMLLYFMWAKDASTPLRIILIILILTLLATAATLWLLKNMIKPIHKGANALQNYFSSNTMPDLPSKSKDELGVLFQQVEYLMFILQRTITERDRVMELAITSNKDFQDSLKRFMDAKHDAIEQNNPNQMKQAVEAMVADAMNKLGSAENILQSIEQRKSSLN